MSTVPAVSNKATFRRFHDAFANSGDAEFISKMIDEIVEPGVTNHSPVQATGVQVLKELFARIHRVFPDLHATVEDMIEEGDKVVGRNTLTGTHQGEYMGLPPSFRELKAQTRPLGVASGVVSAAHGGRVAFVSRSRPFRLRAERGRRTG